MLELHIIAWIKASAKWVMQKNALKATPLLTGLEILPTFQISPGITEKKCILSQNIVTHC